MIAMVIVYALCWLPLHCVTVLGDLQPSIWYFQHIQLVWIIPSSSGSPVTGWR